MRIVRYAAVLAATLLCACTVLQATKQPVPHRMGAAVGASGGSEVGGFPNAAPLNGSERILADQNAETVNLTPAQIGQYLGIPSGWSFPLPIAFGGTGATTAAVAALNLLPTPLIANGCLAVNSGGTALLWAASCGGSGPAFQVNGSALTSDSTINFQNSTTIDGLTLSFSNPSAGNIQLGLSGTLNTTGGGTGLTATPSNGQLLIGNATGYTLATLTAGSNITITNSAGGIEISSSGGSGSGTVNSGTTNQVGCYTSSGTAISGCTTLPTAAEPAHTGDMTNTAGSLATTVKGINGTLLSGLATGIVKNTTSTGVPSIAVAADIIAAANSATCNAQTGTTYTTVLGDANGCITNSNAAAVTDTIAPNSSVAYPVGTILTIQNIGAQLVSVTPGSGVTFQGAVYGSSTSQSYQLNSAYSSIQLQQVAANTWNVNYWIDPVLNGGAGGAKYTTSGTCTNSATAGDATKGTITSSSAGNCTIIVTVNGAVGATAKTCWLGTMADRTQPTLPAWRESSCSTTTATFSVPTAVVSGDVLSFGRLDWY